MEDVVASQLLGGSVGRGDLSYTVGKRRFIDKTTESLSPTLQLFPDGTHVFEA